MGQTARVAIHWAMLLDHERVVLDMAYVACVAGLRFKPALGSNEARMAKRLVDMGFLDCFGQGEYAPTGPIPEGFET